MRRLLLASLIVAAAGAPAFGQTQPKAALLRNAATGSTSPKPGLWEVTTVSRTAGSDTTQTIAARLCLGAGAGGSSGTGAGPTDMVDLRRLLPRPREAGMACDLRDVKQQGAQAQWRVACSGKQASLNGAGKLALAPASFDGSAELLRKPAGGRPAKVEQQVTGKWLGACP